MAQRAWRTYSDAVNRAARPAVESLAERLAGPIYIDLLGFWLAWHLNGGFEGLRALGMSRATIYRQIKRFRTRVGVHPDEFQMPGVSIDIAAHHAATLGAEEPA